MQWFDGGDLHKLGSVTWWQVLLLITADLGAVAILALFLRRTTTLRKVLAQFEVDGGLSLRDAVNRLEIAAAGVKDLAADDREYLMRALRLLAKIEAEVHATTASRLRMEEAQGRGDDDSRN